MNVQYFWWFALPLILYQVFFASNAHYLEDTTIRQTKSKEKTYIFLSVFFLVSIFFFCTQRNWKWSCLHKSKCAFNLHTTYFVTRKCARLHKCKTIPQNWYFVVIGRMGIHSYLHIYVWMSYCICIFFFFFSLSLSSFRSGESVWRFFFFNLFTTHAHTLSHISVQVQTSKVKRKQSQSVRIGCQSGVYLKVLLIFQNIWTFQLLFSSDFVFPFYFKWTFQICEYE